MVKEILGTLITYRYGSINVSQTKYTEVYMCMDYFESTNIFVWREIINCNISPIENLTVTPF